MAELKSISARAAVVLVMSLTISLAWGCGATDSPERVTVSGSVTFNGEPVEDGTVSFIPAEGTEGPTAGAKIENGKYVLAEQGPVVGRHKVEIRSMRETGREVEAGGPLPPGTMVAETEQYIPAKYNTQTELTVNLKSGENIEDFTLESSSSSD